MEQPLFFRTRAHVLVCTGPSCGRRGARAIFERVWQVIESSNVAYYAGGQVRLTESGCQGACDHGPNAIAYYQPEDGQGLREAWYHDLDAPKLIEIAQRLHRGDPPPPKGRYDT